MVKRIINSKNIVDKVLEKILIPPCFGDEYCPNPGPCPYDKKIACEALCHERYQLTDSYEFIQKYEGKITYYKKRIKRLEEKGIRRFS